ncbi:hypothetical protein Tsp_07722 [Trichinella spiralis]|uniref:hypothetical protein n=1 Tax=Trichinella spiralis TaxID=6334 RepID=UPI0001EFC82A|nr:hypothetical protein Tsp_07722 [Trichinella spiralis]
MSIRTHTPLLPMVTDDGISQRYCWNNLDEKIALQRIVTLSTVCPFLFVNRVDCGCRPSQGRWRRVLQKRGIFGLFVRIFVHLLTRRCRVIVIAPGRQPGSERAVPILFFFVRILKFLSTTASFDALCDSLGRTAGNVLRGLKMANCIRCGTKDACISAPVRVLFDDDDDGDGVKPQLLAWSGLSH